MPPRHATGGDSLWSDVYTFAGTGAKGVTAMRRMTEGDGQLLGVVAVDIKLSDISAMLERFATTPGAAIAYRAAHPWVQNVFLWKASELKRCQSHFPGDDHLSSTDGLEWVF